VQNLTQCVESAGVQVEALVLSPLASAQAVLEEEETVVEVLNDVLEAGNCNNPAHATVGQVSDAR